MPAQPSRRSVLALAGVGALAASLAPSAAAASPAAGRASLRSTLDATLTAVPTVKGPVAETPHSHLFSSMRFAKVPFDVRDHGYVEEEFFVSGAANVYDKDGAGRLVVATEAVAYTNRILVRRPSKLHDFSGVVLVDILNASNGYDVEDHWRRTWDHAMAHGHAYVGITSKPINVDALKNFDAERYADLSWELDPSVPREPVRAEEGKPFDPFQSIPGTEEGLAWDIITQVGTLLRSPQGLHVLGGLRPRTVLLMGQSQSGVYLNSYTANFHDLQARANGRSLWDGYLNSVGATLERPLRQSDTGGFRTLPGEQRNLDVPFITVSSESDYGILGGAASFRQVPLGANRRHWQVPGTPHTWVLSPVIPQDDEVRRSARVPRTGLTEEFKASLNPYPLEPTIVAAVEALVRWVEDGVPAAASSWFDIGADGELVRDADGNVTGGLRHALIDQPLGQYVGYARPGDLLGTVHLLDVEEFTSRYGTRARYLALIDESNEAVRSAGYLTESGAAQFRAVAGQLMDRIGVPA